VESCRLAPISLLKPAGKSVSGRGFTKTEHAASSVGSGKSADCDEAAGPSGLSAIATDPLGRPCCMPPTQRNEMPGRIPRALGSRPEAATCDKARRLGCRKDRIPRALGSRPEAATCHKARLGCRKDQGSRRATPSTHKCLYKTRARSHTQTDRDG
jgi:hypothetical protein